ncbi:MAG: aminotransferase class IV [Planctomycetota bacterium]
MKGKEPIVYLRGEFLPASRAALSIYDCGVTLGATVVETTRTFRGEPYRLEDHIGRLYRSMKACRMDTGFDPARMRELTMRVVRHNARLLSADEDLGIIHFVTPGTNPVYAGSAGAGGKLSPTVGIHTFVLPFHLWKKYYTRGAHVVTPSTRHVPPVCVDPKIKNRSRLHWWIADGETRQVDRDGIPLLLDLYGNITETGGANFLIVKGGEVLSPTSRNILEGVSREVVRELCGELAIPFHERDLAVYDVVNADEAFLTSTPYCLAPVTHINNIPIASGRTGPTTKRLLRAWSDRLDFDIVGQITKAKRT